MRTARYSNPFTLMLKKILIVCLLVVGTATAHAQTFKISDVDANDKRLWNNKTQSLLGKSFTLTFFDRTVRIQIPGQQPLVLKKTDENSYYYSQDRGTGTEVLSWLLRIDTTLGVITSAVVTETIADKPNLSYSASLTISGKRF